MQDLDDILEDVLGDDNCSHAETAAKENGKSDDDETRDRSKKQFQDQELKAMESRVNDIIEAAAVETSSGMNRNQVKILLKLHHHIPFHAIVHGSIYPWFLKQRLMKMYSMVITLQLARQDGTKGDRHDIIKTAMKETMTKSFKLFKKDSGLCGSPGSKHVITVN